MKRLKRNLLGILTLLIPILLQAAEFEVKVIKNAADLPEPFHTSCNRGILPGTGLVADRSQSLTLGIGERST
jgi:hypothetical protein